MKMSAALLMRNINGELIITNIFMMINMKSSTHNGLTCNLDEFSHVYTVKETGQVLTSGTTFIGQFFPKFDAPKVAGEIAEKRGTTPAELLKEWKEKGDRTSHEGTLVHLYSEYIFNDEIDHAPYTIENDVVGKKTVQMLMAIDTLRGKGFEVVGVEKVIFSTGLGVAGMIDLLLKNSAGQVVLLDWKTNETLNMDNPFQFGLDPLSHLEDSNLIRYTLQLSLYQYILITEGYFPAEQEFKRLIVHLMEDDNKPYFCKYLESEIESMLI